MTTRGQKEQREHEERQRHEGQQGALPEFPGEVVTRALVRYVDLPLGAGTAALVTLDNGHDHTKPSTFGTAGLRSLGAALDEVEARGDVVAVALTGKPFVFVVGADLKGMRLIRDREQARQMGRLGHAVFRRLGELAVPTFAFINGAAMGGGLEVALHCTYRTISSGAQGIALPECFLGLIPGWGGSQLLPQLIGPDRAVKVIIENALNQNRTLRASQAFELGIADAMFEPADFLEQSLLWAARVLRGEIPSTPGQEVPSTSGEAGTGQAGRVERPDHRAGAAAWEAAVARGRAFADGKVHGAAPAPYRALDLITLARTASRDEGFAAEDEAAADLFASDELHSSLYAFDLVQRRAKHPAGVPGESLARPVSKVGIVGAGLMASQLALLFVQRLEVPVVLTDIDAGRLDKGVGQVHAEIEALRSSGRMTADRANRLTALVTGSLTKDAFAGADLVIEAVFEELKVKQRVFADLEAVVPETCVLATNTSSLPVTEMAALLRHPERVVGLHFFNPVAVLPLVEVVRAARTDDATLATAFAVGKQLKKSCVLVKDAPAFVVNRLLTRFLGEVLAAADAGTPIAEADRALESLGLPMSPFVLLQLVGPAVALHVAETLHEVFPERFGVSETLGRLVAAGKSGVYTWDGGTMQVDPEVTALLGAPSAQQDGVPQTAEQVQKRAEEALAQEIRLMLDDGIVAEPQDVDLCLILGAGWPFHLGGITPYLDRAGVSERVTGKRFLPPGLASR